MVLFIIYFIFFVAGVVALMMYRDIMSFVEIALCVAIILFSVFIIYSSLAISCGGGVAL